MPNILTDPRVIAAALGLGGGLLQGIGDSKNADANRQLSREELLARQYENAQDRRMQQQQLDLSSTQMDPLAQQRSRQQNALRAAIVGGARNFQVTPPSDFASYMPQMSGGLRIPEGGFGPEVMNLFSPGASANAEAQFYGANPRTAPQSMESVGYSPDASTLANQTLANNRSTMLQQDDKSARERAALMAALQGAGQSQQQKGGGAGGFLGGLLKIAAPFASFLPGVGPLLGMGLAAGGSALGSKLQGGGLSDMALSAGMGALGSKMMPNGGSVGGRTSLPSSWQNVQQTPLLGRF